MPSSLDPRTRRHLRVVILIALIARLAFALTRDGLTDASDEVHWDGAARAYWLSGLLHPDSGTYRPPLFPLTLAAVYGLAGHNILLARLLQVAIGTVTCLILFALGRQLVDERVGLTAAGLGALYPMFVFFSGVFMAEAMLLGLIVATLWLSTAWERADTPANSALLGGAIGLAALCKPVMLAWLPLLLLGWLWRGAGKRTNRIVVFAVTGAVVLPWTARNVALTGHLVPISSNVGMNLLIGHESEADGSYRLDVDYFALARELAPQDEDSIDMDHAMARQVLAWTLADPLRCVALAMRKFFIFWSPLPNEDSPLLAAVGLLSTGPLIVLGWVGAWRLRDRPGIWNVVTLATALTLVHMIFFAHARFRLPVDAALIAPAAFTLNQLWDRWFSRPHRS